MSHRSRIGTRVLALGLAAALLAPAARAADVDKYLPKDTEQISVINVRQILGSALLKKVGLDNIREALKANEEVAGTLKGLGFDPLKDIDRIIAAQPATAEQDKGLV